MTDKYVATLFDKVYDADTLEELTTKLKAAGAVNLVLTQKPVPATLVQYEIIKS